jgi:two-component system CheB/CheR fusion protein
MSEDTLNLHLEALLDYLKRTRGFDFTAYKRSTLSRRIQKRMQMVGMEDYDVYLDYLQVHPDEFSKLFNMILINVTTFFRDASTWEYIGTEVIPRIIAGKQPGEPIRIWSAGCASGEEAYTVSMLFCEALGIDAFRERVKVYATDADEEALAYARQASYTPKQVADLPEPLQQKYFEVSGQRYLFHRDVRKCVIFGRHDLIQDAPISRVDLLICRNTLMYFNSEAQARILDRFNFALNDRGFFLLGKAEMLFTYGNLFTPVDMRRRVFTKQPRTNLRDRLLMIAHQATDGASEEEGAATNHVRIKEVAFEADPIPQVVIDASGLLSLANQRARSIFGLTLADVGRPLQDLELS